MNTGSYIRNFINAVKGTGGKKRKRTSSRLARQPVDRVKMEIRALTAAVENALDPYNPDRIDLLTIYENSWKDSQVISEREKAEAYLITEPYCILTGGKPSEEKTNLLKRPWFNKYLSIALYAEFWEYTLAEFQEQDANGEFTGVKVFPRKHVRPFEELIVMAPTDREGICYSGIEKDLFLIPLGDPYNVGKLESIAREVIWKNFARSDWSEYNERYGKPFVDYAIDTENEAEIQERVDMAANFGSNGYMVHDIEEKVTITHNASRASSENFKDLALFCDDQIAKLMNGQTGTSDEKSFVGAAEVHERVLETFNEARLTRIQDNVNYYLLPFLAYHGYPFTEKDRFVYPVLEEARLRKGHISSGDKGKPEKPKHPDDPNKEPDANASGKKKIDPFARLGYEYAGGVILPLSALAGSGEVSFNPGKIEKAIKKVYDSKRPGNYSREIWEHDFSQMSGAITGSTGVTWGGHHWAVIQNLRYNTAVFDAFKSNKEIKDAWRLLVWEDGTPRSWEEFRRDALRVAEKYNQRWLQTEFNDAHTTARAAEKWQTIVKDADLYPNLRFIAVLDGRGRLSHVKLHGCVIPINHPLMDSLYPPLDHGCRCGVQQTDDEVKLPDELPTIPEKFQHNAGKTAQIYDDSHPYYSNMTEYEKDKIFYFVRQNIRPAEEVLRAWDEYSSKGDEWKKQYFNGDNGGWLVTHADRRQAANASKNELAKFQKETDMCRVFAKNGYRIEHLPEMPSISGPDVLINGIPADLKRVSNHNNILKYALKAVRQQGAKEVLFCLDVLNDAVRFELSKVKQRGITVRYFVTGDEKMIHVY
jgi:SPP1 gp7 family putative phage head morphogenesis protein